jgi:hypothetical protein
MLLPGVSDTETLDALTKLCGDVALHDLTAGGGDYNRSRVPVMDAAMTRQLPAGRALVLRAGTSPLIVTLPMVWNDPACKRARSLAASVAAQRAAVPAPRPVPALTGTVHIPELTSVAVAPASDGDHGDDVRMPWDAGVIE